MDLRVTNRLRAVSAYRRDQHDTWKAYCREELVKFRATAFFWGVYVAFWFAVLLFALVGGCTSPVRAQVVGVKYLAVASYDRATCNNALKVFRGTGSTPVGLSFLWGTFGDDEKCVRRFLKEYGDTGRGVRVHIHATNETCRRSPRFCEAGREVSWWLPAREYNHAWESGSVAVKRQLVARLRNVRASIVEMRKRYPGVTFSVSTGLEDNFTDIAARRILRIYNRILWDHALIVRNPNRSNAPTLHALGGTSLSRVDAYELHAIESRFERTRPTRRGAACLWSNDGNDIRFRHSAASGDSISNGRAVHGAISEVYARVLGRRYRDNSCEVWLWWNTQGLDGTRRDFIPPSSRDYTVSGDDVLSVRQIVLDIYKGSL